MKKRTNLLNWLGFTAAVDFERARPLGAFLGFLISGFLIVVWIGVLGALAQFTLAATNFGSSSAHEAIRNIGLVLVAVLGAPFVAWRSYVAHKQTVISEQNHITEQINLAVEGLGAIKKVVVQLDSEMAAVELVPHTPATSPDPEPEPERYQEITLPNIEVRIGAIFALERIAQDSDRDYIQIMEILTAYVRENSPASSSNLNEFMDLPQRFEDDDMYKLDREAKEAVHLISIRNWCRKLVVRNDIRVAMSVIGRRSTRQKQLERSDKRYGKRGYVLDLRQINLQGLELSNADLAFADLSGSSIEGCTFIDCQFEDADLSNSIAHCASFLNSSMKSCGLDGTNLTGTLFSNTTLDGVDLTDAKIKGTGFHRLSLERARFSIKGINSGFGDGTFTTYPEAPGRNNWPKRALASAEFHDEWMQYFSSPRTYNE